MEVVMPRSMRTLGVLLLLWAAPANSADPSDPTPFLKGIEKRYNNVTTLQVNFAETYARNRGPKRTEKGILYRRKPNKMRWEYTSPAGKLWVIDGKFTYSYDPADKPAKRTPFKEDADMRVPLAFMLGQINFDRDFGRYETDKKSPGLITAFPKSDNFPYTQVTFQAGSDFSI